MTVTDLASLVAPCSEEAFVGCFLRKERLSVQTTEPGRAESLLPRWMLERLIASDVKSDPRLRPRARQTVRRLEVLRGGDVVEASRFRRADGSLRHDAMATLVEEGVSFLLGGLDEDIPALARLADALERRLGHTVWVNAYVTHGEGGALPPHYDDHDVLVLQVHGRKRWFGHGTPHVLPIHPSPDGEDFGEPRWDVLVEPGDVLYLPRGEVHHTRTEGAFSVHLTFGIDTRRGVDFLASITDAAASEPVFREDLTRLGGEDALRQKERQLKDRLHALIEAADVQSYLDADDAERPLRPVLELDASSDEPPEAR